MKLRWNYTLTVKTASSNLNNEMIFGLFFLGLALALGIVTVTKSIDRPFEAGSFEG